MSFLAYENIFVIVSFILPGYLVLYTISIITDYLYEKDTLDRIIHYLFFSFICYFISTLILTFAFFISGQISISNLISSYINLSIFYHFKIPLSIISIIFAPIFGFTLGTYYFKNGYPFKHFKKLTKRKYLPSIYAGLTREYSKGAWITLHLNDKTIIQGEIFYFNRDEEKKDYTVSIINARKYYPNLKSTIKLKGEKVIINLKDTTMIELNN